IFKKIQDMDEDKYPYEIPKEWKWARLGNIVKNIVDGTHHTPTYTESGVYFVSVKDIRNNQLDLSNTKFISQEEHELLKKRCYPEKGDLLITKSGTIGRTCIVETDIEFSLFVSVALIKFNNLPLHGGYIES